VQWTRIVLPLLADGMPKRFKKEVARLTTLNEKLEQLRRVAETAHEPVDEAWKGGDRDIDRRSYFRAMVEAYDAEVELRSALEFCYLAENEAAELARQEKRKELQLLEDACRESLAIPSHVPVPPSALASMPTWYRVRQELANMPGRGFRHEVARDNSRDLVFAQQQRDRFAGMLRAEAKKQEHLAKGRERAAARAAEEAQAREEEVDARQQRVAELLGT